MKKEYIKPRMIAIDIKPQTILCVSNPELYNNDANEYYPVL